MAVLDYNEIAASYAAMVKALNSTATELVGLDAIWFRTLPYKNSEDVVFQEYTLTQVDCGSPIKVVASSTDWNAGNFKVDFFGISYEAPLSVDIDVSTWEETFGKDCMPQQGDIVYIKMMHRLFEVKTSTISYTIAEMATSYKCQLSKYSPTASRREPEDLRTSIEELTVSQEDLFGDAISKQVADVAAPVDFGQNLTTLVDPGKAYDPSSVITGRLEANSNVIAEAWYDFIDTSIAVTYTHGATFPTDGSAWLFTCWMKHTSGEAEKTDKVTSLSLYREEGGEWLMKVATPMDLAEGDAVTLKRGSLLSVQGIVTSVMSSKCLVSVKASDALKASKKLTSWWAMSGWTVVKSSEVSTSLFRGIDADGQAALEVGIVGSTLTVAADGAAVEMQARSYKDGTWNHVAVLLDGEQCTAWMRRVYKYGKTMRTSSLGSWTNRLKLSSLAIDHFEAGQAGSQLQMCNIRLYEVPQPVDESQVILDSQSRHPANESYATITDSPNVDNKMDYIGRVS